jgi:hypothetical protein
MSENSFCQYDTPTKARVRGAVEFLEAKGIPHFKQEVFDFFGVSKARGWAILDNTSDRRHHNDPEVKRDHRGRPKALSAKEIHQVDRFLRDYGWEARVLTWDQLAEECELGVCGATLRKHMGSMDYHKCIACSKGCHRSLLN